MLKYATHHHPVQEFVRHHTSNLANNQQVAIKGSFLRQVLYKSHFPNGSVFSHKKITFFDMEQFIFIKALFRNAIACIPMNASFIIKISSRDQTVAFINKIGGIEALSTNSTFQKSIVLNTVFAPPLWNLPNPGHTAVFHLPHSYASFPNRFFSEDVKSSSIFSSRSWMASDGSGFWYL